jgi:6-phosphogluconolactonase
VVDLHICADAQDLATRFAAALAETIATAVARTGRCALALSGGNTPRRVHQRLASAYRREVRWDAVDVFWGDERYVPADDPRSNYRMARETLLEPVGLPRGQRASDAHGSGLSGRRGARVRADAASVLRRGVASVRRAAARLGADGHTAVVVPRLTRA